MRGKLVNYLSLIIVAALLVGVTVVTRRARSRSFQQQRQQHEQISFGTEVMTTSGLYGTVVGLNADDTAQLSIAPGVEVKWALAALRDVASLPPSVSGGSGSGESDESTDPPGS
jgi:preprotein translocase subunit YajC